MATPANTRATARPPATPATTALVLSLAPPSAGTHFAFSTPNLVSSVRLASKVRYTVRCDALKLSSEMSDSLTTPPMSSDERPSMLSIGLSCDCQASATGAGLILA